MHWMALYFSSCDYPKFVVIVLVPQNLFMFALFTDFYVKAYVKKKPTKKVLENTKEELPIAVGSTNGQVEVDQAKVKTN